MIPCFRGWSSSMFGVMAVLRVYCPLHFNCTFTLRTLSEVLYLYLHDFMHCTSLNNCINEQEYSSYCNYFGQENFIFEHEHFCVTQNIQIIQQECQVTHFYCYSNSHFTRTAKLQNKMKMWSATGKQSRDLQIVTDIRPKKDAKWLYRYKTRVIIEQVFPLKHKQPISLQAPPVCFLSDSTSIRPLVKQAIYLNKYCPDCKTRHGRGESSKINRFYAK